MREGRPTGLSYSASTWRFYGEVGLPGRLQLTASLPYVSATNFSRNSGVRYNNEHLGDVRLALDHSPFSGRPLTLGVEVQVPGYRDPSVIGSARGIDDAVFQSNRFPALGTGGIEVRPRLQFGTSLYPLPAWSQVELGYAIRGCRLYTGSRCSSFRDGPFTALSFGAYVVEELLSLEFYARAQVSTEPKRTNTLPTEQSVYLQGKIGLGDADLSALSVSLAAGGLVYASAAAQGHDLALNLAYSF